MSGPGDFHARQQSAKALGHGPPQDDERHQNSRRRHHAPVCETDPDGIGRRHLRRVLQPSGRTCADGIGATDFHLRRSAGGIGHPDASASGATSVAPPSSALPSREPSLRVILQRPAFAKAFAAMDGASALPAWVNTADQSQPSTRVQVGDQAMWLSRVCGVSGCQGGQLFVLTDPAAQKMQGLLVVADGTPGATVRQLTWLGQPGAALQSFLKAQTNRD